MVGIIGVDPGVTTGISWGVFNEELRDKTTNWNALAKGRATGCMQIGPKDPWKGVKPTDAHTASLMVAEAVVLQIGDFTIRGLGRGQVRIPIEHFELRGAALGATSLTGLSPVWIAAVLWKTLGQIGWEECITWVKASTHMGYATDHRIKKVAKATKGRIGWTRGRPHTRDSWRLVAWELNKVV